MAQETGLQQNIFMWGKHTVDVNAWNAQRAAAKGIENGSQNGSAGTGLHNIPVVALHGTQEPGLPLVIYHAVWLGFQ